MNHVRRQTVLMHLRRQLESRSIRRQRISLRKSDALLGVYKLDADASLRSFEVFFDISTMSPFSFSFRLDSIRFWYVVGKASSDVSFLTKGELDGTLSLLRPGDAVDKC